MKVEEKLEKLEKIYKGNKLSHAYLVETNNIELCYKDLLNFIKRISCNNDYRENCNECNLCNLINTFNLPSLVVLEPDGKNIKKEQVVELKKRFSTIPVFTKENIYIIKEAEKLNGSSANTMLKFIEEPSDNILGFFLTNNLNNVISTIRSRCEILNFYYENSYEDASEDYYEAIYCYIKALELEKRDKIMYNKNVLLKTFSEREDIEKIFKIMLNIYTNYYLFKLKNISLKEDKCNFLKNYSLIDLKNRIELITKFLGDIKTNANIELLLDKYVIELSDCNV